MYIPSNKTLKLNLNGHTLKHTGTGASPDDSVIKVEGTLEITGDGKITGGRGLTGGGIYINGGKVIMNGGAIEGNYANQNGGGVYVGANGSFDMTGGSITGNTATQGQGGGIYANSNIGLYGNSTISNNSTEDIYLKNAQIDTGTSFHPSKAVSVTLANGAGVVTNGNIKYTDGTAKSAFSSQNSAYEVHANESGQAALKAVQATPTDTTDPTDPTTPTEPAQPATYTVKLTGGAMPISRAAPLRLFPETPQWPL